MQQFRCSDATMIAGVVPLGEPQGPSRRFTVTPLVELAVLAVAAAIALMLALARVLGAARRPPPPG